MTIILKINFLTYVIHNYCYYRYSMTYLLLRLNQAITFTFLLLMLSIINMLRI